MNNPLLDNISERRFQPKKLVLPLLIAIVLTLGFITAAYVFRIWPFVTNDVLVTPTAKTSSQATQVKAAKTPDLIAVAPPETIASGGTSTILIRTKVDTKEQGDCTLTIVKDDFSVILTNSTKSIKGQTGCLDWNIGSGSIKPGEYKMTTEFVSTSGKITKSEDTVTFK